MVQGIWLVILIVFAHGINAAESVPPGPDHPGAEIYRKLCVECHGKNGEGVKGKADDPLYGNRDVASLARRIDRTMPEDEEELCVAEDAKAVAEYIYDAFYSVEARARNTPARIWIIPANTTAANMYSGPCEIARLTITTATAPVAPDIIPGRPPRIEVTIPTTNAA